MTRDGAACRCSPFSVTKHRTPCFPILISVSEASMDSRVVRRLALYVLQQNFGHNSFRPGQLEVIQSVLCERQGRAHVIGSLPTGSGKVSMSHSVASIELVDPWSALMITGEDLTRFYVIRMPVADVHHWCYICSLMGITWGAYLASCSFDGPWSPT